MTGNPLRLLRPDMSSSECLFSSFLQRRRTSLRSVRARNDKYRLQSLIMLTAFFLFLIQPAFASENARIEAYGIDTVAGSSTILKAATTESLANEPIIFLIEKPGGGEIFLDAETNDDGIAALDLLDYHTRKAGTYTVSAKLADDENFGPTSTFRVYPDEISELQSQISVDKNTITANGVETALLTVTLSDRYGNPLPNHTVDLISSRPEDSIIRISQNPFSDAEGKIRFAVATEEPGVSIYSAFDTTAGKSLGARVKVASFSANAGETPNFFGGDSRYLLAQSVATAGSGKASSLKIENLSDIVPPNSTVSFTVAVYEENGDPATSYAGTVRFTSSDANASLPRDYTFTASDLGRHTFSLGLKFLTEGVQTLEVVDTSSVSLKATAKITVTDEIENPGDDKTLVVLLPTEGVYSQSQIDVEGEGPAGWVIEIYDNMDKVGETIADSNSRFYFTLKGLESGPHDIYAAIADSSGTLETSKTVAIMVDDSAPGIDEVTFVPEGNKKPGEAFEIRVFAESELQSVAAVIDVQLVELMEDISQKGLYTGEMNAPLEVGEYPVDIILTDELWNSSTVEGIITLRVAGTAPLPVTGVSADAGPEAVILSWESVENVAHYRIYYGTDQYQLDQTVDTPDSSTSFEVIDLTGGVKYFFAVTAVDEAGVESEEQSELVSAVPLGVVYPDPVTGVSVKADYQKVTLSWTASSDDTYIDHYRIYYGTAADNLSQTADTFNGNTTWYIPGLTGGVIYYFAVTAVDSDGYESQTKSPVISGMPLKAPLPGQTPETGPGTDLLLGLSLLGAEGYVLRRYFRFRREYMRSKGMEGVYVIPDGKGA